MEDLEKDGFKVSGYFFDGSAVVKTHYYVNCPTCKGIVVVPDEKLSWYAKDKARDFDTEVLPQRKANQ